MVKKKYERELASKDQQIAQYKKIAGDVA